MGPRLFRRGDLPNRVALTIHWSSLQWGHAFSGVETFIALIIILAEGVSFNGATPFQAWRLIGVVDAQRLSIGFNGATPFQAWRRLSPLSPHPQSPGFNGATPFQAWRRP